MKLENHSFDAVITDRNGQTLEVDCRVTEPRVSGAPADISIEIPLSASVHPDIVNPCTLRGADGGYEIEIRELWYRSIPLGGSGRKHERGTFDINHAGQLMVRMNHVRSEAHIVRFHLSPVRFFKKHNKATMIRYAATPQMSVELFKIQTAELGEVRFIKHWTVNTVAEGDVTAEIRAGFAAEIRCDEAKAAQIDLLVRNINEVLTVLSMLFRQAVTLHGWERRGPESTETLWFVPLEPNLAPDMGEEPSTEMLFPGEFDVQSQALVEKYLAASAETREAVTLLSVALAPHIKRTTQGDFAALFSALEQAVSLEKLTAEKRAKLKESDDPLVASLMEQKAKIEAAKGPHFEAVAARLDGLAKAARRDGASFNAKFENFVTAYPQLRPYMSDLWPLTGSQDVPGLKQIRDSLAHGLRQEYSMHAVAVARWHFARLAERLAFILVGAGVPKGIHLNSSLLSRDSWYDLSHWREIQAKAKRNTE